MKIVAVKEVPIGRLRLPGDFPKRLESDVVKERAAALEQYAQVLPVAVRSGTMEPLNTADGVDWIAAYARLRRGEIWVMVIECTDDEFHLLRHSEMINRRHLDAGERLAVQGQILSALEKKERAKAIEKALVTEEPMATPTEVARRARAKIQTGLQLSKAAYSKAQYRARKKLEQGIIEEEERALAKFGMQLTENFESRVRAGQKAFHKMESHLHHCIGIMNALRRTDVDMSEVRLKRIAEMLRETAQVVRGTFPVGLCPFCKGLPKLSKKCLACHGSAILSKNQEQAVPAELKDTRDAKVWVDGEAHPIGRFLEEEKDNANDIYSVVRGGAEHADSSDEGVARDTEAPVDTNGGEDVAELAADGRPDSGDRRPGPDGQNGSSDGDPWNLDQ